MPSSTIRSVNVTLNRIAVPIDRGVLEALFEQSVVSDCARIKDALRSGSMCSLRLTNKPTDRYVIAMAEDQHRQPRAERTRATIIDAAATAFGEHGYEGVSLSALVRATGVSKGAFYFHFPSKEELALAAFATKQQTLLDRLVHDAAPAGQTAGERLVSMLRRRNALLAEDPSLACVIRLGNELNVRAARASTYTASHTVVIELIAAVIDEGQRRHEFRTDLDPDVIARAIFGWVVGIDTLSYTTSDGTDLAEHGEQMLALLLHGLLVSSAPGRSPHTPRVPARASRLRQGGRS
jgi:AcrR family transcriptional regulator